jgi:hypothetical protein
MPPLAPVLRSDALGRTLAAILLSPDPLHIRAISDRTGLPYSVVQREIDRLEESRLVRSTRFGRSRVIRANPQHPLFPELRALLLKAYGPAEMLAELLAGEKDVSEAYIYGSWAARYVGEWGEPPADVDVLLIGDVGVARRDELEAEAEDLLGQPVQIEVLPEKDWASEENPFVRTIKGRPIVPIGADRQ